MLGVGRRFPSFSLKGVAPHQTDFNFPDYTLEQFRGQWVSLFFWPKDFTFVCPTEITTYGKHEADFRSRNTQVLGASIDSEFVHLAWKNSHPDLKGLPFPWLSDIKRDLSQTLGILDEAEGVSQRASYLIDPEGIIRFVMVTDLSVGRNVAEVLRVLDALQTNTLTPCQWRPGDATL